MATFCMIMYEVHNYLPDWIKLTETKVIFYQGFELTNNFTGKNQPILCPPIRVPFSI